MRVRDSIVCLAVDRLAGFMKLAKEDLDPLPGLAGPIERCGISGYAREGDALLPVLDIAGLLDDLWGEIPEDNDIADRSPREGVTEMAGDGQARDERDR